MALNFDLKNALNNVGTDGQATFGAFQLGTYTGGGVDYASFTVFNRYQYVGGGAFTPGDTFNPDVELGWMHDSSSYPHVGIENINNNTEIVSNLWNESIYFHPGPLGSGIDWTDIAARPCVVRFLVPFNGTVSGSGNYIKGAIAGNTGWTILKNGIPINARVEGGNASVNVITLNSISLTAGDKIDFVLDMASDTNVSDDSAITLDLSLTLDDTPAPVASGVNCTATTVSGTIPLTQAGTVTLKTTGGTTLGTGTITAISGTVNGQWSITGLNLLSYGGQDLKLTAVNSPAAVSAQTNLPIGNTGCCPTIVTHPQNATICSGGNNNFTISGTGSNLSYQWYLNTVLISGATASNYSATAAGSYTVVFINDCGTVTSSAGVLTVNNVPVITVQPEDAIVCNGDYSTLSVTATGPGLTYQWYVDEGSISGATNSTYNATDAGIYVVGVTNSCGTTHSTGTTIAVNYPPTGIALQDRIFIYPGEEYNAVIEFTNVSDLVIDFNVASAPAWLNFEIVNLTVVLSGTPELEDTGEADYSINVFNGCGTQNFYTETGVVRSITANAEDDVEGNKIVGQSYVKNVSTNDTNCNFGITTFALVENSDTNVQVTNFTTAGVVNYTPFSVGAFSFMYNILCNGMIISTATASGTGYIPCTLVSGGTIEGNNNVPAGITEVYTVEGLVGSGPFTYKWTVENGIIESVDNLTTVEVTPTNTLMVLECVVNNCGEDGEAILTRNVVVKLSCEKTIPLKFNCFIPRIIVCTLLGITESNRVKNFVSNILTFRTELGTRNYNLTVTDTLGVIHNVILKNITC